MHKTSNDFGEDQTVGELQNRIKILEQKLVIHRKKEKELELLAIVVRDSNDAITMQDLEGNITAWNHGAEKIYGYTESEALRMNNLQITPAGKKKERDEFIRRIKSGKTVEPFETQRLTKEGKIREIWLTVTPILDSAGIIKAVATTERDITEKNTLIRQLAELSVTDELTGLYNRRGFILHAEKFLKQVERRKELAVLFYLDMDNLKVINDTAGHKKGDEAIANLAGLIKKTFRETDVMARIGGDEFTILTVLTNKKIDAEEVEIRLQENIKRYNQTIVTPPLSVSIGRATQRKDKQYLEELLNIADKKMYKQKQQKKKITVLENGSFTNG